jgi:hypothetical protein
MSKIISAGFLFILMLSLSYGQTISYHQIDSISYQQYLNGEWDNLLYTGRVAEKLQIVYPNLSLRLGYAALMKGNNSLSLKHYNNVLKLNSYNENALYYTALNNLQLSRRDAAIFTAQKINSTDKNLLKLSSKKAIEIFDFEISIKPTNTELRKTGQYYRIGAGNRINHKWKLYHSFATYRQNMLAPDTSRILSQRNNLTNRNTFRKFLVSDFQYYLKSEIYLTQKLSIINAYHFVYTNFDNNKFNTSILNFSIKYLTPYADLKFELNAGPLLDSLYTQMAFSSTYYPKGNINFYGTSRLSFQNRTNLSSVNFSQLIGMRISKRFWLEFNGTFGQIKNLVDNEAFYIYDAIDAGKYRFGASFIFPINDQFSLLSNYYYEQKKLFLQNTKYHLNSFTLGISWKL